MERIRGNKLGIAHRWEVATPIHSLIGGKPLSKPRQDLWNPQGNHLLSSVAAGTREIPQNPTLGAKPYSGKPEFNNLAEQLRLIHQI
ncbi:MAG TPA: hypothetical protein DEB19_06965 [Synechococcales bacterium UBA8138]|nr:hypothetical protein [Synechococcales bacterium UBA8138]